MDLIEWPSQQSLLIRSILYRETSRDQLTVGCNGFKDIFTVQSIVLES